MKENLLHYKNTHKNKPNYHLLLIAKWGRRRRWIKMNRLKRGKKLSESARWKFVNEKNNLEKIKVMMYGI